MASHKGRGGFAEGKGVIKRQEVGNFRSIFVTIFFLHPFGFLPSSLRQCRAELLSTWGISARIKNKPPMIGILMKTITRQLFKGIPIIVAFAGLLATRINTFAIEGIHLSVQSSNVILSWPSTNNGESYIIQYRQTLNAADSWQTLADWMSGQNTIQQCVANAVNGVHNSGEVTMDSSWVIYGAPDLQINTVARP